MPLAVAMSVNAAFILGLVFVPGLWGVVEYLFSLALVAFTLIFAALGLLVMRTQKYFDSFVFGSETSPGSDALVCPGVALSVLLQFWINNGWSKPP